VLFDNQIEFDFGYLTRPVLRFVWSGLLKTPLEGLCHESLRLTDEAGPPALPGSDQKMGESVFLTDPYRNLTRQRV